MDLRSRDPLSGWAPRNSGHAHRSPFGRVLGVLSPGAVVVARAGDRVSFFMAFNTHTGLRRCRATAG